MKAEQSKFIASLKSTENDELDLSKSEQVASKQAYVQEESAPICSLCRESDSKSPVSFFILLQVSIMFCLFCLIFFVIFGAYFSEDSNVSASMKCVQYGSIFYNFSLCLNQKSRLQSFVDRRPPSWDESTRNNDRNDYTTKEKLTIGSTVDFSNPELDLFSQLLQLLQNGGHDLTYDLQRTDNFAFLDSAREDIQSFQLPDVSNGSKSNGVSSLLTMENEIYLSVQTDMHGIASDADFLKDVNKCLDSVPENRRKDTSEREPTVIGECIASLQAPEQSVVLTPAPSSLMDASSKLPSKNVKFERFGPINCDGIHISSCGHAVHRECHDRYLFSLKQRYCAR